jgi:hypothetical protein
VSKPRRRPPYKADENTRAPSPAALKLAAKLAEKLSPSIPIAVSADAARVLEGSGMPNGFRDRHS